MRRSARWVRVLTLLFLLLPLITAASAHPDPRPSEQGSSTSNRVRLENARAGTDDWKITPGVPKGIAGYANRTSQDLGGTITLFVDTKASSFHVEAYRLGYYGGLGGRLVWTSRQKTGVDQPEPTVQATTNMVEARWTPSLKMSLGSKWIEGSYLLKLVSSDGGEGYIPMVVRDDSSTAPLVLIHHVTTWLAYNRWGGYSLYEGPGGAFEDRSRVASFDRPYGGRGAAGMLTSLPFIALVEKAGMDVTYWTSIDLQQRSSLLAHHEALISLSHDEYWSREMRDNALSARDTGVNIAFLGGNAVFRKIRFNPSPLGDARRVVNYKIGSEDPLYGIDDPAVTSNWRADPVFEPETQLVGGMYECNPVLADMVVVEAADWVFDGTGISDGDHIGSAVAMEYDSVHINAPTPRTIRILAHSPLMCNGRSDYSDMTYYTTSSQAGVLDIGSQGWVQLLTCGAPVASSECDSRAYAITRNILETFALGPAGIDHPAVSNLLRFHLTLTDPLDP